MHSTPEYIYRARIVDTHGTARIQPWIRCLYICLHVTADRILRTEYSTESAILSIHCTLDESHRLCNCPVLCLPSPSHSIPFFLSIFSSFRDYGAFPAFSSTGEFLTLPVDGSSSIRCCSCQFCPCRSRLRHRIERMPYRDTNRPANTSRLPGFYNSYLRLPLIWF